MAASQAQRHIVSASAAWLNSTSGVHSQRMVMHTSFYWGYDAIVLFSGWPGRNKGMYALSLIFVFVLAVLVELLSHCKFIDSVNAGYVTTVLKTVVYGVRCGLSYMLVQAVMSFNGGVFLAAVGGHAVGSVCFRPRASKKLSGLGS